MMKEAMDTQAVSAVPCQTRTVGPIILLGPPGAGKGTQADRIRKAFAIPHISTGEILRANVAAKTRLGNLAKIYMERGDLVRDEQVSEMVAARLVEADCSRGFILDGFPRTVAQARWLDQFFSSKLFDKSSCSQVQPIVIDFQVEYNQLLRRLTGRRSCPTCGRIYNIYFQPPRVADFCDVDGSRLVTRKDDSEAVISERLKEYERQTLPLVEYYRQSGRLHVVDADRDPDTVAAAALKLVGNGDCL
jgi:adenylate kinase